MNVLLILMAYATWYERKVLAAMQDRLGPTRTGWHGLGQPLADAVKLLGKEDLVPAGADRKVFLFAPLVVFVTAILSAAVIPFGGTVEVFGRDVNLYITDLNVGALFILPSAAPAPRHHPRRVGVGQPLLAARRTSLRRPGGLL